MFSIKRIILMLMLASIIISCSDSFLNVDNPDALNSSNFPSKIEDVDLLVAGAYGRLRKGILFGQVQARIGAVTHYYDQAFSDQTFDQAAQINFPASNPDISYLWSAHFENINKINGALEGIEHFREKGSANIETSKTLDYREGELKFLRAWNYFYLINFFGKTFIISPADADADGKGVPLFKRVSKSIEEGKLPRASIGAVWNFIKSDLRSSASLLEGNNDMTAKARVNKWAAKSFLGKCLIYTQQWDSAKVVLKDVIDNSGKSLVPYNIYQGMFNNKNTFTSESIFEINYNDKEGLKPKEGSWDTQNNASNNYHIMMGPCYYLPGNNKIEKNGYGNFVVHDKSLLRFGWTNAVKDANAYKAQAYIDMSVAIRNNKSIDPRTWVNVLQPMVDSVVVGTGKLPVAKDPGEGALFGLPNNYAWGLKKFVIWDRPFVDQAKLTALNLPWLRLADVYLLYAEACKQTTDNSTALEYINKVKRRAYGLDVNTPSASIDYASLTAQTQATGENDPLKNDPLKYERWAELFGEHVDWWFDVCRWRIGGDEAKYYERVTTGELKWNDNKYALPIPTYELDNNNNMKQNEGY